MSNKNIKHYFTSSFCFMDSVFWSLFFFCLKNFFQYFLQGRTVVNKFFLFIRESLYFFIFAGYCHWIYNFTLMRVFFFFLSTFSSCFHSCWWEVSTVIVILVPLEIRFFSFFHVFLFVFVFCKLNKIRQVTFLFFTALYSLGFFIFGLESVFYFGKFLVIIAWNIFLLIFSLFSFWHSSYVDTTFLVLSFEFLDTLFLFFFFSFLGPHLWHMEVPRLGVELEL